MQGSSWGWYGFSKFCRCLMIPFLLNKHGHSWTAQLRYQADFLQPNISKTAISYLLSWDLGLPLFGVASGLLPINSERFFFEEQSKEPFWIPDKSGTFSTKSAYQYIKRVTDLELSNSQGDTWCKKTQVLLEANMETQYSSKGKDFCFESLP